MHPIEVMEHEPRSEADGIPLFQVTVDALGALPEQFAGAVQLAVVPVIMDPDLEAILSKPGAEVVRHPVLALGDEIERGPEPKRHLELSEGADFAEAND
jgi:hypothetical protein